MPTNYTGVKTNTQAPSAAPKPDESPILALPADGDPPNASTFEQAYQVVADFIHWLMTPVAKVGDFATHVMAWRAANGHKRFAVDHLGFPGGQIVCLDKAWPATSHTGDQAGTPLTRSPDWIRTAVGSAALGEYPYTISVETDWGNMLTVFAGTDLDSYEVLNQGPHGLLNDDLHLSLDFTARLGGGATFANRSFDIGIGNLYSTGVGGLTDFFGFRRDDSSGQWQYVARKAGLEAAAVAGVAVAVSPAAPDRLRIEYHGANVAEDANRAIRFFINGDLVGTVTNLAHISTVDRIYVVISDVRGTATPADISSFHVGPMRLRMNLFPLDIVQ